MIDISAKNFEQIYFSAGKIGMQVKIAVEDIEKVICVDYQKIIK